MNSYYSNIYWHFTGSPNNVDWSKVTCPNDILLDQRKPKSENECLRIIDMILNEKRLKASSFETIDKHLKTNSFCCVTDIPIQNLNEHRDFYGHFAIGFRHPKIHSEFNPVFYIDKNKLEKKTEFSKNMLGLMGGTTPRSNQKGFFAVYQFPVDEKKLGTYIHNFFKITLFSDQPGRTFYREREWRKIGDFNFEYSDVAALIVPLEFLKDCRDLLELYSNANIPIITWELLENA